MLVLVKAVFVVQTENEPFLKRHYFELDQNVPDSDTLGAWLGFCTQPHNEVSVDLQDETKSKCSD